MGIYGNSAIDGWAAPMLIPSSLAFRKPLTVGRNSDEMILGVAENGEEEERECRLAQKSAIRAKEVAARNIRRVELGRGAAQNMRRVELSRWVAE